MGELFEYGSELLDRGGQGPRPGTRPFDDVVVTRPFKLQTGTRGRDTEIRERCPGPSAASVKIDRDPRGYEVT